MAARRFGFIGGGVMAEAIIRGLLHAGAAQPRAIAASDPLPERRALLEALGVRAVATNPEAVARADVVVVAVKPAVVPEALGAAAPALSPRQLVVSIAAGVPLARLEPLLGEVPVVRAMPNVLASVRAAATAICPGARATADHLRIARELFETVGCVVELPETHLDAVTALSGSGPGYVALVIEALADGGVLAGLPRAVALQLAVQTVLGTAKLVQESGEHPAVWKDRVATPGGTTIAGLRELEAGGVRAAFIRAVDAAARRAREISGGG